MDLFSLAYYGAVCALLCLVSPYLGSVAPRIAAGVAVGVIAPLLLGPIRLAIAGY